jgi:glucoamylase
MAKHRQLTFGKNGAAGASSASPFRLSVGCRTVSNTMFARTSTTTGSAPHKLGAGLPSTLVVLLASSILVFGLCGAGSIRSSPGPAYIPLISQTVAVAAGSSVVDVDDQELVPGTRVLAHTDDSARSAAEQLSWLAAGKVPRIPELASSTMVPDALLDLYVLGHSYGVAVAGWAPNWRYVWPRDSALVATALARTGHVDDAERLIGFLEQVQPKSGVFEARYQPDGSGVPDRRGVQSDGIGWALWAMDEIAEQLPATRRPAFVKQHRSLLHRSTQAALAMIENGKSLPAPSSDYWERKERKLTLATAALLLAGLRSSAALYGILGEDEAASQAATGAAALAVAVQHAFARDGFPRTLGGRSDSVDLGVSFLLPPFAPWADPSALQVWRGSVAHLLRPAGGLAPGGSWREDGVSWNTATSSYAMTAAFVGDRSAGVSWLRWLDAHRTQQGSLPEKVLYDGQPASVAPLAWAAAAVIIAVDELAEQK